MPDFIEPIRQVPLETVFSIASAMTLLGWAILILLPRRSDMLFSIPQYIIPFLLALLYAGFIMTNFFTVDGGYGSLAAVKLLFQKDELILAGWIHYLAFDLFIGAWVARQADALGIHRVIQAVLLLATFMFGPIGLGLFLVMKFLMRNAHQTAS